MTTTTSVPKLTHIPDVLEMPFCDGSDAAVERLARENNWTQEFALLAVHEYRRFLSLCGQGIARVPSPIVDKVWHFHILDTRNYAPSVEKFVGKMVHHSPSFKKTDQSSQRLAKLYRQTLTDYLQAFGTPDPRFWSSPKSIDNKELLCDCDDCCDA